MPLLSMLIGSLWSHDQHADLIAAEMLQNVVHEVVCNNTSSCKAAAWETRWDDGQQHRTSVCKAKEQWHTHSSCLLSLKNFQLADISFQL